jgi:VanZ family protein
MDLREQFRLRQRRAHRRCCQRQRQKDKSFLHRVLFCATFGRAWQSRKFVCSTRENRFSSRVTKLKKFLLYWLPPLLWMALIFSASADTRSYQHSSGLFVPLLHWLFPAMSLEHIEMIHHAFRKCGHLTEFAILALLYWRAIHHTRQPIPEPKNIEATPTTPKSEGQWRWDEAGLALTLVFAYAASDEFHQIFVPLRTALVSDIFIDTSGGAAGLLVLWLTGKIFKHW